MEDSNAPLSKDRLWDYHAEILKKECEIHKARIQNLFNRWERKSYEGFLPPPRNVGIFGELSKMNEKDSITLSFITDPRLKKWETKNFEDIYTLTDRLGDLHFVQAVVERCYWQRMEGYEAAAVDAVRRGAFSEAGTIEQICNSADFLCQAYWDRVFGEKKSIWRGIVSFGLFNEFRNLGSLVFAPDYVKLYNFKTWVYFAHEIIHGALSVLLERGKLAGVFYDLICIFSRIFPDLKTADDEYLAMETICDIMSTLVAGEAYIQTLASLKFYPTVTVGSRSGFFQRGIQYPMIWRTVISGWTMRIAWGFTDSAFAQLIPIQDLIKRAIVEDAAEQRRILSFLRKDDAWIQARLPTGKSVEEIRDQLENLWDYITYQYDILPGVVQAILSRNTIPRIKRVISRDFYATNSSHFFYEFDNNNQWLPEHILDIDPVFCQKTSYASDISLNLSERKEEFRRISRSMLHGTLVTEADPTDIVACLTYLANIDEDSKKRGLMENVAIASIASQIRYSNRRFQVGKHSHTSEKKRM
jgi:hypothetical protein